MKKAFDAAIEAFKKADTVRFNSVITNEEALMLQTLKEKMGVKLINPDARAFQKVSWLLTLKQQVSLFTVLDFKDVMATDFVMSVGTSLTK